jgi:phenylpropionate dioxygenase-like ring-hydroxylating dioxygenase large terminal subunit
MLHPELPTLPPQSVPPRLPPAPPLLSHALLQGITVDALPVVEADGLVWIWPGSPEAMAGGPPEVARPPPGFQVWHWWLSSG